jgi:uncharacterized protein involved in oxidation of intracellular sulfur
MKFLFVLNDPPYGSERGYNALRLAASVSGKPDTEVRMYLMGDASLGGKRGQKVPTGYYNFETMLRKVIKPEGGNVGVCGTCMDARGIANEELGEGTHRGTMAELTDWTLWADRVLVF